MIFALDGFRCGLLLPLRVWFFGAVLVGAVLVAGAVLVIGSVFVGGSGLVAGAGLVLVDGGAVVFVVAGDANWC